MQKSSSGTSDEPFCTRSGTLPVRRMGHSCEGEQPEEEDPRPVSQKTRRKRFHTQPWGFALAV